jgi:hypothetical protein
LIGRADDSRTAPAPARVRPPVPSKPGKGSIARFGVTADPYSTGRNWQKLDFGPVGARIRAAKPLLFSQTMGQIP